METIRFRLRWALAIAAVVSSLLIFPQLGSKPFWDYDEAIYAGIVSDTQASGDVFVLQQLGQPFFEKPPFYFWSSMVLDTLLQTPEWSYRLTSAIAGVACVILVALIAWETSGSALIALLAALILSTTGAFIAAAREMRLDLPTIAAIMAATYCFVRARRDPRWLMGIGIAIALGFLSKSVVALLAGVFILVWSITMREWSWLKSRYLWLGALIGIAILLPWHVYESVRFGSAFWDGYFWHNVVDRVSGDLLGGTQTIGDYVRFFLAFAGPWSIMLLLAIVWMIVRGDPRAHEMRERVAFVFVLTTVLILALFTASSTRIFYYLLPAYPFMALAVAFALEAASRRIPRTFFVIALSVLMAGALWVTFNYSWHRFSLMHTNDVISADEAAAAETIRSEPMSIPVYSYQYDYWDTFAYYSGGRSLTSMSDDAVLDRRFFLLVSTPFMQSHAFDAALAAHLAERYAGPVVTLFEFRP